MLGTPSESCAGAELDGLASFLSLSTIQTAEADGVILAQAGGISTAGKLDLPFRFGRHAVAGRGTIPPGAHRSQDVAVARGAHALQNERTMHATVGADDE